MDKKIGKNQSTLNLAPRRMVILEVIEEKISDDHIQLGYYVGPKSMNLYERIGSKSGYSSVYVYKDPQTQACEIYIHGVDTCHKVVDEIGSIEKISEEELLLGTKSLKEKGYKRLPVVGLFLRGY